MQKACSVLLPVSSDPRSLFGHTRRVRLRVRAVRFWNLARWTRATKMPVHHADRRHAPLGTSNLAETLVLPLSGRLPLASNRAHSRPRPHRPPPKPKRLLTQKRCAYKPGSILCLEAPQPDTSGRVL